MELLSSFVSGIHPSTNIEEATFAKLWARVFYDSKKRKRKLSISSKVERMYTRCLKDKRWISAGQRSTTRFDFVLRNCNSWYCNNQRTHLDRRSSMSSACKFRRILWKSVDLDWALSQCFSRIEDRCVESGETKSRADVHTTQTVWADVHPTGDTDDEVLLWGLGQGSQRQHCKSAEPRDNAFERSRSVAKINSPRST